MSGPKVPKAGNVSNTQLDYARGAANYQNELNQVNQVTPTGSLTYTRTGTNPDGSPITTATSTLNAANQDVLNKQLASNALAANTAYDITNAQKGKWAAGPDLGPTADETGITKAIMGWGHDYLDPGFERAAASEDAKLANQGIMPGSEAYNNAITNRNRGKNDAYTQLLLQGQGQALSAQQLNMLRGEKAYMDPLNAIATLSGGQQPPSISYAQTPQAAVQSPDYTTASNNEYTAKKANSDALMGGLFKIPQTILGGWASGGMR